MAQPIIKGIQAVGGVRLQYRYNGPGNLLTIPSWVFPGSGDAVIQTSPYIELAGFRLDSEFVRAEPGVASSYVIPLLGGGGLALTNNNRSGTLSFSCSRVSSPNLAEAYSMDRSGNDGTGGAISDLGISSATSGGDTTPTYDMVLISQIQQAQPGGDSAGAHLEIVFDFNARGTRLVFEACTVASVSPLGLSGNDASNYAVTWNYLNWTAEYSDQPLAKD